MNLLDSYSKYIIINVLHGKIKGTLGTLNFLLWRNTIIGGQTKQRAGAHAINLMLFNYDQFLWLLLKSAYRLLQASIDSLIVLKQPRILSNLS